MARKANVIFDFAGTLYRANIMILQYIENMASWQFALCLSLLTLGFIHIQAQCPPISDSNKPRLYEKGPCTSFGLFEHYIGITTADCLQECQRRTMCKSVNFNPFNKFCALRDRTDFGTEKPPADWCYNIIMANRKSRDGITSSLVGPCKDRPCDNTSVCLDVEGMPYEMYWCKKAYCMSETDIPNAFFRISSPTSVGKRNELVCKQGYMSIGSSSRECLPSGNWSESCFSCVKYCPAIPAKSTASVTTWSTYRFVENTTATFVCKEGFYNITERKIVCDKNGDWSKFDCLPYCRQKDLIPLPNGYPLLGDNYTINDQAEYACNADFYLSPGSSKVTCDVTGKWSMPEVKCYPYCHQPELVNGYLFTLQQGPFKENESLQYSCADGYYLASGQTGNAVCLNTGEWTKSTECYKYCGAAPTVKKAYIESYSSNPPYKLNDTVTYTCWWLWHLSQSDGKKVCNKIGYWEKRISCCGPGWEFDPRRGDGDGTICRLIKNNG